MIKLEFLPVVMQMAAVVLVLTAGFFDLRERRVPNWLALAGVSAGLMLNGFVHGLDGLKASLLGAGLALLIYVPMWLLHAMGAGDAKLMAAVGAIVGPASWFSLFLITAVVGGIVATVVVLLKGRGRRTFVNLYTMIIAIAHRTAPYKLNPELDVQSTDGVRMPHAVTIACGTLAFLVLSAIYRAS